MEASPAIHRVSLTAHNDSFVYTPHLPLHTEHSRPNTMSAAGFYIKKGISIFNSLEEGKPHSSITDWVEVLSSDRYDELSLDGIPELVESINIQGHVGTTVSPPCSRDASTQSAKRLSSGSLQGDKEEAQVRKCPQAAPRFGHSACAYRECGQGIPDALGEPGAHHAIERDGVGCE